MKRIVPMPDLSAAPRRKRALSEEERALWDSVAKQVKPLRKHRAAKAQAPQVETQAVAKPAVPPKSVPARAVPAPKSAPPLAPLVAASGQSSRVASRRLTPALTCTA